MKSLLTFLLLFAYTLGILAQNSDFAPVGARWHYTQKFSNLPFYYESILESSGKVSYQGKLCSELFTDADGNITFPSPAYIYTQNDTVYFFSPLSNQFEMLYDFTASVGDQWVIGGLEAPFSGIGSDTITVDSISSIIVNDVNLKVWHISNTAQFDWGDRIIEKVGNDKLFAPSFTLSGVNILGLRCYEDSLTFLHFVPYPCDFYIDSSQLAVLPINLSNFKAYPNPTNGIITLSLSFNEGGLVVAYNTKGEKLAAKTLERGSSEVSIDLSQQVNGLYALAHFDPNGQLVGVGRVVVSH